MVVQQPQGSAQPICTGPNLAARTHHNQRELACRGEQLVPANADATPKHISAEATRHERGKAATSPSRFVLTDGAADASCAGVSTRVGPRPLD